MKRFQGRVITPGQVTAEAVVTKQGFNTLASFQMALQFGDKEVKCGDQNNEELHGKPLIGKALCLPQTIGSTTGGLVLYCACEMARNPACMLFANHIDSLAAAGAVLADVCLGIYSSCHCRNEFRRGLGPSVVCDAVFCGGLV